MRKLTKIYVVLCLLLGITAHAQEAPLFEGEGLSLSDLLSSSEELANLNVLQKDFSAEFKTLDRYLNKIDTFEMEAGSSSILYDSLLISLKTCIHKHNGVVGNDASFVVISNRIGEVLFSGWLMSLYPGASLFEHSRYNIFLEGCQKN